MNRAISGRQEQITPFHTVGLPCQQALSTRKPATGLCDFAVDQRNKAQPKCAADCALRISSPQEALVRPCQKLRALRFLANQLSGLSKLHEIVWVEPTVAMALWVVDG